MALGNSYTQSSNQDDGPPRKRKKITREENLNALELELLRYIPKEPTEPSLFLAEAGFYTVVKFLREQTLQCDSPVFLREIIALFLKSLIGRYCPFKIWSFKLELPEEISKSVLLEIDGLNKHDLFTVNSELNTKSSMFRFKFEIISSTAPLATELSTSHMPIPYYKYANRYYSSLFPLNRAVSIEEDLQCEHKLNRLHLLLTPVQLAMENYPLPINYFELSQSAANYIFTKDVYSPVTINSPMFALDCEMVKVESGGREIARISLVNENLEVVYSTLVMPEKTIMCYLTEYSGITEEMLEGVTVKLADVQRQLRRILPPDAILCGQSLNNDLHCLQMIHPYVIDTSVIFHACKLRNKKKSLKFLTKYFLKEDIQTSEEGHNPIEDATATMKLIQFRLKEGKFSDNNLSFLNCKNNENCHEVQNAIPHKVSDFCSFLNLSPSGYTDGFFPRISRLSKTACLIGSEVALDNYYSGVLTDNVTKVTEHNLNGITNAVVNNIEQHDCIIAHIKYEQENCSIDELIAAIAQIHHKLPKYSMFLNYISGVGNSMNENIKHNICMAKIKK